jgi:hypothetical protein
MLNDELLTYLFDGQSHILTTPVVTWLGSSRRFTAFVTTSRNKIRKKLRIARDEETVHDLRLELETAYLLLQERSLSLEYEPEHTRQIRSPDFAVTFTTSLSFMVEVTRLRGGAKGSVVSAENGMPSEAERLADVICSKLGQLFPQRSNVLIAGVDAMGLSQPDLQGIMLRIQQRAERNEPAFWQRFGFEDRADFFRHYQRLSELIVRGSQLSADTPVIAWVNPQAKHALPARVRTALHRSHAGIPEFPHAKETDER